jgi:hypothetical protein
MDENGRKVLEMLADGKITASEAERLLDRLGRAQPPADVPDAAADRPTPRDPKYLRIVVEGSDTVNVRIPMALVKTGIRLGALMPAQARKDLEGKGVDLSALSGLDGEELVQALAELTVDVDTNDGDHVRVFCE